ncbi:hypothetical protein D3C75_1081930 [compost metagenome]
MEGIPAAIASTAVKLQTKKGRFRDLADAVRPAGNFGVVQQQNTDDFTKAERDDRQIVSPQA